MASHGPIEIAISSDLRGAPYSFSLWDIHTGAQLITFKGTKSNPISKCLQLLNQDYFITAIDNLVQIWSIYNRKSQDQKLFLPGRPSSLASSPCGNYLIAGISEMIYIWQLCSGNLYAHMQRHYQTVTILRMSQDGTYLFSGAEDGIVLVWPFGDLVSRVHNTGALNIVKSRNDIGVNEPRHTWQHHCSKITDIHVTNGGRCITTSIDKTLNIYNYVSGQRIHCISNLPTPIWSVIMNKNETMTFLGGQDGNIYILATSSLSVTLLNSIKSCDDIMREPTLVGHRDRVTNLLISLDGTLLISGSLDSTCKIWDIQQGKMVKDMKHQAPIANLVTAIVPEAFSLTSMTQGQSRPPLLVKQLKRNLHKPPRDNCLSIDDVFDESCTTLLYLKNKRETHTSESLAIHSSLPACSENIEMTCGDTLEGEVADSSLVGELKSKLKEMYVLSTEKIFKDAAIESLKPIKKVKR